MTKVKIQYSKPERIDLSILGKQYEKNSKEDYNPFQIENLQLYNPLYNQFFTMNKNNYDSISFNHKYQVIDLNTVQQETKEESKREIHIKFSPLLDPYRYMIGKYNIDDVRLKQMPRFDSNIDTVHPKILTVHNASYVDSFFCFLTSIVLNDYNVPHGLDYYGSYLGLQKKHRLNIADDIEYLRNSDFFNNNIGKYFYIEDSENEKLLNPFSSINSSRKNKLKLSIKDSESLFLDCEELPELFIDDKVENSDLESVYSKTRSSSLSSSSSDSSTSEVNYSSDETEDDGETEDDDDETEDDEDDDDDDETEDDDEEIFGYIHNFPIQMICMEKCDGTLDELFVNEEMDDKAGASMLMQVVMILLIYQKMFKFTHNDLHTNNIMFVNTDQEYLYYQFDKKTYKVPTYGKIYKIIDFGRGIYRFNEHVFCSDSFAKDGDAATQYNCEPFFNDNRPRLEPNTSFDLCRLGSSLFDFVTDISDDEETLDDFQKTIKRWCMDDNGKNILYKKNGQERYPNFKLYKMIARTVHKHTPEAQLEYDIFKQFCVQEEITETIINIDELPVLFV
jgi:hypothetical protein